MSDLEHDTLDELYTKRSFNELCNSLGLEILELKPILKRMIDKKLVNAFSDADMMLEIDDSDYELNYMRYHYLASRKGLEENNVN